MFKAFQKMNRLGYEVLLADGKLRVSKASIMKVNNPMDETNALEWTEMVVQDNEPKATLVKTDDMYAYFGTAA